MQKVEHDLKIDEISGQIWDTVSYLEEAVIHQAEAVLFFIEASCQRGINISGFLWDESNHMLEMLLQMQEILLKKIVLYKKQFGSYINKQQYQSSLKCSSLLKLRKAIRRYRDTMSQYLGNIEFYRLFRKLEIYYRKKHNLLTRMEVKPPRRGPLLFTKEVKLSKTSLK
ncbi:hypothetical protein [Paenibacillus whitsoniae]|uniref:Uncharacterized protein n=1 Tax=Paenibacillus whitsoniae TaxID=2496558 RepID=A0A3R9ZZ57_9BACL|nr:hypothetical protein [Paenibacillus whitsoniae]RTE00424.1 hypothetical protein EJQ19_31405 [Paenibacillus whitsoniae]